MRVTHAAPFHDTTRSEVVANGFGPPCLDVAFEPHAHALGEAECRFTMTGIFNRGHDQAAVFREDRVPGFRAHFVPLRAFDGEEIVRGRDAQLIGAFQECIEGGLEIFRRKPLHVELASHEVCVANTLREGGFEQIRQHGWGIGLRFATHPAIPVEVEVNPAPSEFAADLELRLDWIVCVEFPDRTCADEFDACGLVVGLASDYVIPLLHVCCDTIDVVFDLGVRQFAFRADPATHRGAKVNRCCRGRGNRAGEGIDRITHGRVAACDLS